MAESKDLTKGNGSKIATREQLLSERAGLVAALARAPNARARLNLMISTPHAELVVPTLPAEEVYFTVKEVGINDSLELIHLAGPEQFRTFVDLDAWKRDRIDVSAGLLWLRAAATDDNDERFQKKLARLDIEVIELLLKTTLRIWDLTETPDPEPSGPTYQSPEGQYLVEFLVEGASYLGAKRLLDQLYAKDPFRAARMLEAVRWELPTELEETAYRWRNARLADLGFPDLAEALSFFAYVDPDAALPVLEKAPAVPEGLFLARLVPAERFFDRAVQSLEPEERGVLERQLVTLLNAVMVAESVEPGELEQVQRAIREARDTLSLGLEHAARGDPSRAGALLASAPLKRIFQIGVSLALKQKFRVDRLMRSGRAAFPNSKDVPLFDAPVGEALVALRRRRPLYSEALDRPEEPSPPMRPARDLEELAKMSDAVTEAERMADLMEKLGFESKAAEQSLAAARPLESLAFLRFSDLYLSAVARELVGESFAFAPLPASRLADLAKRVFQVEGGKATLTPEAVEALRRPLEREASALSPEHRRTADRFAALCVRRLTEEAGAPFAASGKLDPELPLPFVVG
ncbi:MAG: DUF6178 family protein [Myxococcales bacterium]|jgi:hypothetical protein